MTAGAQETGFVEAADGTKLYYERTGEGTPVVFVHEFAGDYESWEPQVRHFSRRFSTITYNARGYPPSDVPENDDAYSFETAIADLLAVLDHLKIEKAHIVGFSMGSFVALFFGARHPERVLSVVPVGCGYGAEKGWDEIHRRNFAELASALQVEPEEASMRYARSATRTQLARKDPRGWAEFAERFAAMSTLGRAKTLMQVITARPSIYDKEEELSSIRVPVLLITGDEDEQTLAPGVFMKKHIATCGLCVLPSTGHTPNLEEPARFNQVLSDFLLDVEIGAWRPRSTESMLTDKYMASGR